MNSQLGKSFREYLVSLFFAGTGLLMLAMSWNSFAWVDANNPNFYLPEIFPTLFLTLIFIVSILLVDLFPLHIRHATKISLISIPLFLVSVMLPVPLAMIAAGAGILLADIVARNKRGLLPQDILRNTGRWMVLAFLGSQAAQLSVHLGIAYNLSLLVAALVLFAADILTFSLGQVSITGDPYLSLVITNLRESYLIEGVQYLVGILGALAAVQEIWALLLLVVPTVIIYIAFKNLKEMRQGTREMLEGLADAVDLRDPYTGGHSHRVAEWTEKIVHQLNISGVEADIAITAARLHDIGKIGIPDHILSKPGALTPAEMKLMRDHSQNGGELLARYTDFSRGAEMVVAHHERWDGDGYPRRQRDYQIPFGARVIAVADSFDAMTSDRPYRKAYSYTQAANILIDGRGRQWDAKIVDALLTCIADQLEDHIEIPRVEQQISPDLAQIQRGI